MITRHQETFLKNLFRTIRDSDYKYIKYNGTVYQDFSIIHGITQAIKGNHNEFMKKFLNNIITTGRMCFTNKADASEFVMIKIHTIGKSAGKKV